MNEFPSRVTLYDDGVYRWSYTMDMWRNRYILRLIAKILGLIAAIPALLALASLLTRLPTLWGRSLPRDKLMWLIGGDLKVLLFAVGLWIGFLSLVELVYAIFALAMHGKWRLCFQMDETAVALVGNPNAMKAANAIGTIAVIAGIAAGRSGEALRVGSTLAAANGNGTTHFETVRRVRRLYRYDLLEMRAFMGMNQIYVPHEDYDDVRDFILAHVPEKARLRSYKEV